MKLLSALFKTTMSPNNIFQYAVSASLVAAFLLLLPLSAKLILDGMAWSFFDFVAAWILLFGAGFTYRMVARKMGNISYRAAVGVAVSTALFLVWSNLAVGLLGSEDNPANWMYVGVLAIGFLGSIITQLQPKGMSYVLFAMASAHFFVAIIALMAGLHLSPESSVAEILGVNGFFAVLWIASALLFRNAAQKNH